MNIKNLLTPILLFWLLIFSSGCMFEGFSQLPEINFIGRNKEEVVRIFSSNPHKAWGTRINICTPLKNTPPYDCYNNRYFKTAAEALADEEVKKAPALSGYRTPRRFSMPEARDYYIVFFDKNGKVISQKTFIMQDGM